MLIVGQPELDVAGPDTWRVSARLHGAGLDEEIFFTSDHPIAASTETFLAAALLPAMALGTPLQINGSVSSRVLRNVDTLQEVFTDWHPRLSRIAVHVQESSHAVRAGEGDVLAFFSGGVDSFATVCRHRDELSRLLLVRGFDVSCDDDRLWTSVQQRLAKAADELGHPLVTVETNVRRVLDRAGDWGFVTHGAAMASVAHLFGPSARRVLVAASHHLRDRFPWGTHPLVDPLWSSDAVDVVHDGAELTRLAKTLLIAEDAAALGHLRVCWRNPAGAYNCGRCEKCVRTMISLDLAGRLGDCATLPHSLEGRLRGIVLAAENAVPFARDNLTLARQQGRADIVKALESALRRYELRQAVRVVRRAARSAVRSLRHTVFGRS